MSPDVRRLVRDVAVGALLLGLAAGVAWPRLAPALTARIVDAGGGAVIEGATSSLFDRQVALAALLAASGLVLGTWVAGRHRGAGAATAVALTLGGLAGSALAWQLGQRLGPQRPEDLTGLAVDARVPLPLELDAYGVVLLWPIASLLVLLAVTAWAREPVPRPGS